DGIVLRRAEATFLVIGVRGEMRRAVTTELDSYMTEPLALELFHLLQHRFRRGSACVGVAVDSEPALSAQQLVDRYTQQLALDVPESLIQAAQCVVEHRAVSPVRTYISGLPDVFNVVDVFAAAEIVEILVHSRHDGVRTLAESGATQAVQAWLIGFDFDDNQFNSIRRGGDSRYFADFYRWKCGRF